MPSYASGSAKPTQALISFVGITTSAGNLGGTTLVCSSLTAKPDYDGQQVLIMSGDYVGQVRDIDGATTGGTVTVTAALGGQIVSDVKFFILAMLPMSAEVEKIMGTGFDTATDSLVVLHDDHITEITTARLAELDPANIPADTAPTVMGRLQIKATTIDLNQAAATYDLFTATTQDVVVEKLVLRCPALAAGGALTSISIQSDDATPIVLIDNVAGAVANLTSEAQLAWTGAMLLDAGTGAKIRLTIAGGAHGVDYVCDVVAECRAVVAGGYLA